MRDSTIATNYAETLLTLAGRANDLRGWGAMITDVADAMGANPKLRLFLESPRIAAADKNKVLQTAFAERMPRNFLRFLQSLVMHRRQMLIPEIAKQYLDLVDAAEGRMHARVTVARETPDEEKSVIAQQLSRMFGKDVVPHLTVDPSIMGGVIVHVGDTVLDGSVKKRLAMVRRRMLTGG
ncbi:MAG: synthase subunit delta [Gemmatimonadetes bacterium]|nr:synthase subunit delta [Gemmatimonadota bacterium]